MASVISIGVVFLSLFLVGGCKHEVDGLATDVELFNSVNDDGYSWYVGTPVITSIVGAGGHGWQRVRFNPIAQAALDSADGELPSGGSFPPGSIIVKEVYDSSNGGLREYAVMKKEPSSPLQGSGWLWAEFDPDGTANFSTGRKGDGCIGCHGGNTNRDLVRIFDLL